MTKKKHSFKDLNSGRIDITKTTIAIKLAHLIFFFKGCYAWSLETIQES